MKDSQHIPMRFSISTGVMCYLLESVAAFYLVVVNNLMYSISYMNLFLNSKKYCSRSWGALCVLLIYDEYTSSHYILLLQCFERKGIWPVKWSCTRNPQMFFFRRHLEDQA